ncbi:MAG: HupE/UreJ family protein [Burkholderiaceae bacterium]
MSLAERVRRVVAVVLGLVLAALSSAASAHKPSDAYLFVTVNEAAVELRWDIALRDLDAGFDLDADGNRELTWGEVKAHFDEIDRYALARLTIDDGRCVPKILDHALDHHSDGAYLVLRMTAACKSGDRLKLGYTLFTEMDPTHRGIARVGFGKAAPILVVLDPASGPVTLEGGVSSGNGGDNPFAQGFFPAGVHHILIGYDHVLFLICLLLPAVLARRGDHWVPVARWRDAVRKVLITVTAFTIAHTLTLALAGLRIVELSPRVIEPAIAATIIFTALGNIRPNRFRDSAAMPFAFGLVHGFGFADVLHELDLPMGQFVWALLRFNLGVEAGQLLIVAVALLPLYLLRHKPWYRSRVLVPVSLVAIVIAGIWFAERVFDFKVLPV